MPGTTTYYNLNTYSNTPEDGATSFYNYRLSQSGPSGSNATIIDTALHTHDTQITALQATRGAITVNAGYVSTGYYEATTALITAYVADMPIILKLNVTSIGTTTLKINALATKSLLKSNAAGVYVNLTGNDLIAGKYYLFRFDVSQDAWIWVNQINTPENGWTYPGETWVYASTTSFTIAGVDRTSIYTAGLKIKCTNNGTVRYFYVLSSSFSTNTTVTITGGSSFSLANSAITENYYSRAENPTGFPDVFDFTPVWSCSSGTAPSIGSGVLEGRFKLIGKQCFYYFGFRAGADTTFGSGGNFVFTIPLQASNKGFYGLAHIRDTGTANYVREVQILANMTTVSNFVNLAEGTNDNNINNTTPITWVNGDSLAFQIQYEIA